MLIMKIALITVSKRTLCGKWRLSAIKWFIIAFLRKKRIYVLQHFVLKTARASDILLSAKGIHGLDDSSTRDQTRSRSTNVEQVLS